MTNNNNKFNKTNKTTGFFPIKQHRFETKNHPIIEKITKGRPSKLPVQLSWNEKEMVEGLANILQCEENEAIRIALYEFQDGFAETTLSRPGTGRNYAVEVRLPKDEKETVLGLSERHSETPATIIRTAVRWLAKGIRDETIRVLSKSRKIGQKALARKWSAEQKQQGRPKGSKLKALKNAAETASIEKDYQNFKDYEERGDWLQNNQVYGKLMANGLTDIGAIDTMRQIELEEAIGYDRMTEDEKLDYLMCEFADEENSEELAREVLDNELRAKAEDDEELDDEFLEELFENTRLAAEEGKKKPLLIPKIIQHLYTEDYED